MNPGKRKRTLGPWTGFLWVSWVSFWIHTFHLMWKWLDFSSSSVQRSPTRDFLFLSKPSNLGFGTSDNDTGEWLRSCWPCACAMRCESAMPSWRGRHNPVPSGINADRQIDHCLSMLSCSCLWFVVMKLGCVFVRWGRLCHTSGFGQCAELQNQSEGGLLQCYSLMFRRLPWEWERDIIQWQSRTSQDTV